MMADHGRWRPERPLHGFTLVELLVVITIIGILISLLLPAVQSAREAARRLQCSNHLKQLGLALHNYHLSHRQFPIAQFVYIDAHTPDGWLRHGWFYAVLPYMEQQALADAYQAHLGQSPRAGSFSYTDMPDKSAVVPGFMCPSDGANPKVHNASSATNQQGFHGNYVLNGGSTFFNEGGHANSTKLNGLFQVLSGIRIEDIRDGTSNTLLASELILVPDGAVGTGQEDIRGRYHNVRHAGALFSTRYPPNTSEPDRHNYCINTIRQAPCTYTGTDVIVSARSYHPGGVTTAMADASVRFISESIDATLYRGLGTRAGNEPITSF
ncbi:MAG: DUF1559 domain-containing protein [Patescibacteria group bacterium]|nr:DUF1559 domain-containing protein [Patescibacteria group bacterium]